MLARLVPRRCFSVAYEYTAGLGLGGGSFTAGAPLGAAARAEGFAAPAGTARQGGGREVGHTRCSENLGR